MLFHTWAFAAFFAVFYPAYVLAGNTRARLPLLVAASYFFYGCFNPWYVPLMAYATAVDYVAIWAMSATRWRRTFLAVSIVNNLSLLGVFKYARFACETFAALAGAAGLHVPALEPAWMLPVGLSFYTFQSLSYAIDCYRGRVQREANPLRHAAYVALFPQLVAGPIVRAGDLLPQLARPPAITAAHLAGGLSLFVTGLFKKVALADYIGVYVDQVYAAPQRCSAPALILATAAFGWQIYFDFSGYSDMARGIARAMGIELMRNFDRPYLAAGLGEFWNRWHISLSTWFRDYVYVPLGGNRRSWLITHRNMWLTMLLSGLWHGAAWKFALWGAVHAAARSLTRQLERSPRYVRRVPRAMRCAMAFAVVSVGWVFFRAADAYDALLIVGRIFTGPWADPRFPLMAGAMIVAVWAFEAMAESRWRSALERAPVKVVLMAAMLAYLALVPGGGVRPFIYFQF